MGALLKSECELEVTSCCVCATRFAVDELIMSNRREHAGEIFCPNGHKIGWKETDADRVRKQLAAKEQELAAERSRLAIERQMRLDAETRAEKDRKVLKRQTKRINAGVCPHCNRTFQQLARHMECKHSETIKEPKQ